MPVGQDEGSPRPLAQSPEELRPLHQLCREGRLYDVERWIAETKPLQIAPEAIPKGPRTKTTLRLAVESGQHSLALLLLRSGYRLQLERYSPLDVALQARRWDPGDLPLDWGIDLKSADVYTVLNTYNVQLYERFSSAGHDLTAHHAMGCLEKRGRESLLSLTCRLRGTGDVLGEINRRTLPFSISCSSALRFRYSGNQGRQKRGRHQQRLPTPFSVRGTS